MKTSKYALASVSLFITVVAAVMLVRQQSVRAIRPQASQDPPTQSQRFKTQTFLGEAAVLRAQQLRKDHKGVARAMADATKRGLRAAFEQGSVVLGTDTTRAPGNTIARAGLIRPAAFRSGVPQDTFTLDGYEVTFIPYDDGDPGTWEGIIYRNGPDIDEDIRYAVINITTEDPQTVQEIYYPPDGGQPEDQNLLQISKRSTPKRFAATACNQSGTMVRTSMTSKTAAWTRSRPLYCPAGTHQCIGKEAMGCCGPVKPIDPWIKCSIWGASGSALTCALRGPGWGACWSIGTIGTMFGCLRSA